MSSVTQLYLARCGAAACAARSAWALGAFPGVRCTVALKVPCTVSRAAGGYHCPGARAMVPGCARHSARRPDGLGQLS